MSQKSKKRSPAPPTPNRLPWLVVAIGGGLLLLVAGLWALAQPAPAATVPVEVKGAAKLKVDPAQIDLGDQRLGQTVSASFTVANVGDQPLQFSEAPYIEVVEGCCPPQPVIGAMTLKPGETTTLSMQFMMHEGMGGPHDFRLHLRTNDPSAADATTNVLSNWIP